MTFRHLVITRRDAKSLFSFFIPKMFGESRGERGTQVDKYLLKGGTLVNSILKTLWNVLASRGIEEEEEEDETRYVVHRSTSCYLCFHRTRRRPTGRRRRS